MSASISLEHIPTMGRALRARISYIDDEGRGCAPMEIASEKTPFVLAVRGAFTHDEVLAKVERVFRVHGIIQARVTHIFKKGDVHVDHTCAHSPPCPACPLHGLSQRAAHALKQNRVVKALLKEGLSLDVEPVFQPDTEFDYRQKTKLMVGGETGALKLGMYVPHSHTLVSAHLCAYLQPELRIKADHLRKKLNDLQVRPANTEHPGLKAVILRNTFDGVALVLVTTAPLPQKIFAKLSDEVDAKEFCCVHERVDQSITNSVLSGVIIKSYGPRLVRPLDGGPPVDVDAFCQTDSKLAQKIYDLVAKYLVADGNHGWFLDAYAGVGGFSHSLKVCGAERVTAVEVANYALSTLTEVADEAMIETMNDALPKLQSKTPPTGIVLDPPRKGLLDLAPSVARLNASRIALVACDPNAMARDLKVFLEHHYVVDRVIPIDFFGGSCEIETVVLMRKGRTGFEAPSSFSGNN